MATFAVPVLGEVVDVVWARMSALAVKALFGVQWLAVLVFTEEIFDRHIETP